jgi:hypothetical protein
MKMPDFTTVEDCIAVGRKVALGTFIIGSTILAAYYFYNNSSIIFLSLFFLVVAVFINTYVFIRLAMSWTTNKPERNKIRNTLFLLLLNIPIAYAYVKIGLEIYSNSFSIQ